MAAPAREDGGGMSIDPLLINTVTVQKRSVSHNAENEEIELFLDAGSITASVQDRSPTELTLPDVDGPVLVNAVIFTRYSDGLAVEHLDRLRQTDVTPNRLYRVITPSDPAGRHDHWEMACERVLTLDGGS